LGKKNWQKLFWEIKLGRILILGKKIGRNYFGKKIWQKLFFPWQKPTFPFPSANNFSQILKLGQVFTSYQGCHGKEKTRSRQEWECCVQPGKLHCWVATNLWESLAPDFWPLECVQDIPETENLELSFPRS